jgi:ketosteroid isomerase-like protein
MKKLTALVLFACVCLCVGLVLADSPKARFSPKAPFNDPTDLATIKQIERELGDATVTVDIEKLNQIYADDFAIIGSSGKILTKESILQQIESGKYKLVSYELGPIDVQVLGNVAVGHGAVTEKRIADGKDLSVELVYMDLFEKRAGKWVLVRSDSGFPK